MKKLLFVAALGLSQFVQAQRTVDVSSIPPTTNGINQTNFFTVGGVPFVNTKYVNLVQGSPYLEDQWMFGRVLSKDGQKFFGNKVRLNILDNQIHFKLSEETELISTVIAMELWLLDSLNGKNYHLLHSSALPSTYAIENVKWLQLLDTGRARLFKVYRKLLSESLPYGSSVHEQRISTVEQYFLETSEGLKQVKKPKDLLKYLSLNSTGLEAVIKEQESAKPSAEEGFLQAIRYYNSLQAKQ